MDLSTVTEVRREPSVPAWRAGDAWLAGGTWLFSEPQPHLTRLIDLTAFGWPALTVRDDGLEIAATCTIAELAGFGYPSSWLGAALFRPCCDAFLASFKIWNVATVGGNLCTALPAGPMIALTVALDGVCTVWGVGGTERTVAAADLVTGPGETALEPGDLLRSVHLPAEALHSSVAFRQASLRPLGRSAALVIGRQAPGGLVVTVTASTVRPVVLELPARPDASQLEAAVHEAIPPELYHDDVHGDPDWRQHLTLTLAEEIRVELAARIPR